MTPRPSLPAITTHEVPRRRGRGWKITLAVIGIVLLMLAVGGTYLLHEYELDPQAFSDTPTASSTPRVRTARGAARRRPPQAAKRSRAPARRPAAPSHPGK